MGRTHKQKGDGKDDQIQGEAARGADTVKRPAVKMSPSAATRKPHPCPQAKMKCSGQSLPRSTDSGRVEEELKRSLNRDAGASRNEHAGEGAIERRLEQEHHGRHHEGGRVEAGGMVEPTDSRSCTRMQTRACRYRHVINATNMGARTRPSSRSRYVIRQSKVFEDKILTHKVAQPGDPGSQLRSSSATG